VGLEPQTFDLPSSVHHIVIFAVQGTPICLFHTLPVPEHNQALLPAKTYLGQPVTGNPAATLFHQKRLSFASLQTFNLE